MRGEGVAVSQPMSTVLLYSGVRIKFGDLPTYLTYATEPSETEIMSTIGTSSTTGTQESNSGTLSTAGMPATAGMPTTAATSA
jgi:hypothetical protein